MIQSNTGALIQQYFRNKTQQILALSEQAVCEHGGLKGNHREDLISLYLSDLIPQRFKIGRGMIYSPLTRSHEADIVLWDAMNFPRLQMLGHEMYFAESVQATIEVKSNYTISEERDIVTKTRDLKEMWIPYTATITDDIHSLACAVAEMQNGCEYLGTLRKSKEIVSIVFSIKGGKRFSVQNLGKYEDIQLEWPDLVLLLETGKVIVKIIGEKANCVRVFSANEDALLLFSQLLLETLSDQVVATEGTIFLDHYIRSITNTLSFEDFPFPVTRPLANLRKPLFSGLVSPSDEE